MNGVRVASYKNNLVLGSSAQKISDPRSAMCLKYKKELEDNIFSKMKEAPLVKEIRSGVRVASSKRKPIFSVLGKKQNIVFLSGFHKSGFLLAPYYARKVLALFS